MFATRAIRYLHNQRILLVLHLSKNFEEIQGPIAHSVRASDS